MRAEPPQDRDGHGKKRAPPKGFSKEEKRREQEYDDDAERSEYKCGYFTEIEKHGSSLDHGARIGRVHFNVVDTRLKVKRLTNLRLRIQRLEEVLDHEVERRPTDREA